LPRGTENQGGGAQTGLNGNQGRNEEGANGKSRVRDRWKKRATEIKMPVAPQSGEVKEPEKTGE